MNGKTIMIVDDDPQIVLGLGVRLKAVGYVVIAGDAISAVSVALTETPDLVILDLGLPAGDGFVVLERMKDLADLARIPVIVLSARDGVLNKKRALEAGGYRLFSKAAGLSVVLERCPACVRGDQRLGDVS